MDKWAPLAPTPRFTLAAARSSAGQYARASLSLPGLEGDDEAPGAGGGSSSSSSTRRRRDTAEPLVGRLPVSVVRRILAHLPLADLPSCALAARALARVVAAEETWRPRLEALDWVTAPGSAPPALPNDAAEMAPRYLGRRRLRSPAEEAALLKAPTSATPATATSAAEDDFGDFKTSAASPVDDDAFGDFTSAPPARVPGGSLAAGLASVARPAAGHASPVKSRAATALFSYAAEVSLPLAAKASPSFVTLRALVASLRAPLRSLPASGSLGAELPLAAQGALVANCLRYFSADVGGGSRRPSASLATLLPLVQGVAREVAAASLSAFKSSMARREDALRAASHGADTARATRRAEDGMRSSADVAWEVGKALGDGKGASGSAKAFLKSRKVLGLARKHDATANVVTKADGASLDFTAMDTFMVELLAVVAADGEIISRVFPPTQDVLIQYAERVATEVIGEYISPLLLKAKSLSSHVYLRSCAATFTQSLRLADALMAVKGRDEETVKQTRCEDVVYRMWEANMDEYLAREREWVKGEMNAIAQAWENDLENETARSKGDAAFLASHNPAAVKRSVLSGFKDVLLLPVTVVPRTAVYVGGAVGGAAVRTAGALNPLRWQGSSATAPAPLGAAGEYLDPSASTADADAAPDGPATWNAGEEEEEEEEEEANDASRAKAMNDRDEWGAEVEAWSAVASARPEAPPSGKGKSPAGLSAAMRATTLGPSDGLSGRQTPGSSVSSRTGTPQPGRDRASGASSGFTRMQLLLSLDTALQLIHVNRDCLKRIETFAGYPGDYGHRVQQEIEHIATAFLQVLGEAHIQPGFAKAIAQIRQWTPVAGGAKDDKQHVLPLVHFFELVHVGDTIQQMVQVYFDQELARHIDRTDFLNSTVREKKRFEGALDEVVARGFNAGIDLLMGQVEHIITTRQAARDFTPEPGTDIDLGPTTACTEAIECLRTHCRMLVGATDKNVLEVFNLEVGLRLHAMLTKHLKRQIISLEGGWKVIADLNAYRAFAVTLRQASVTPYFDALKMLGNLYIVDNPKELATMVRDATDFGGLISPEDLYEYLKSRSDFKAIEASIDKEMYGFKIREDCVIA